MNFKIMLSNYWQKISFFVSSVFAILFVASKSAKISFFEFTHTKPAFIFAVKNQNSIFLYSLITIALCWIVVFYAQNKFLKKTVLSLFSILTLYLLFFSMLLAIYHFDFYGFAKSLTSKRPNLANIELAGAALVFWTTKHSINRFTIAIKTMFKGSFRYFPTNFFWGFLTGKPLFLHKEKKEEIRTIKALTLANYWIKNMIISNDYEKAEKKQFAKIMHKINMKYESFKIGGLSSYSGIQDISGEQHKIIRSWNIYLKMPIVIGKARNKVFFPLKFPESIETDKLKIKAENFASLGVAQISFETHEKKFGVMVKIKNDVLPDIIKPYDVSEFVNEKVYSISPGITEDGDVAQISLVNSPHILIGAETGAGKSSGIHWLVRNLTSYSPDNFKLLLADPKKVELSFYKNLPHLIGPVVYSTERILYFLDRMYQKVQQRNETLAKEGLRSFIQFNQKHKKKMPLILFVIEEISDLVDNLEKPEEFHKRARLILQKGRNCGIQLMVASQRPVREVIPTTSRDNYTTRISLKTQDHYGSQCILGESGAEKLTKSGQAIIKARGLQKIQFPYMTDEDIKQTVTNAINKFGENLLLKEETSEEEVNSENATILKIPISKIAEVLMSEKRLSQSIAHKQLGIEKQGDFKELPRILTESGILKQAPNKSRNLVILEEDILLKKLLEISDELPKETPANILLPSWDFL